MRATFIIEVDKKHVEVTIQRYSNQVVITKNGHSERKKITPQHEDALFGFLSEQPIEHILSATDPDRVMPKKILSAETEKRVTGW